MWALFLLIFNFQTMSWEYADIDGALIFNNTPTHTYTRPSVLVLDFGGDKTASAGDFTIVFPTADASNAILRIT